MPAPCRGLELPTGSTAPRAAKEVFLDAARSRLSRLARALGPGRRMGGLLEGATGIALVLLAAVSEVEPDWDRVLLVS